MKRDSNINSIIDLKDKNIGINLVSTAHFILEKIFKKFNIDLKNENLIEIKYREENILKAFEKGKIDCLVVWDPLLEYLLSKYKDFKLLYYDFYHGHLVIRNELLKNNPEDARKLVKSLIDALKFLSERPELACKWASKRSGWDEKILLKVLKFNSLLKSKKNINVSLKPKIIDWLNKGIEFLKSEISMPEDFEIKSRIVDLNDK